MVRTDLHFFSADALPLVLNFLEDRGFKVNSHRSVAPNEVRDIERLCAQNSVILKVKYHV